MHASSTSWENDRLLFKRVVHFTLSPARVVLANILGYWSFFLYWSMFGSNVSVVSDLYHGDLVLYILHSIESYDKTMAIFPCAVQYIFISTRIYCTAQGNITPSSLCLLIPYPSVAPSFFLSPLVTTRWFCISVRLFLYIYQTISYIYLF